MVPLEQCLGVANECDAPMVSICGGEPLIYPKIEELVGGILKQGRIVYVCTNGLFMRKKWGITRRHLLPALARLESLTESSWAIRNDSTAKRKPVIRPNQWLYWNVHIDGLEYTHDLIVEREGVFKEAVEAIKMAKFLGFQVATNTRCTGDGRGIEICSILPPSVDGHTISPVTITTPKKDMVTRLGRSRRTSSSRHDDREVREDSGMGGALHHFRHAGLPGVSSRQTGADLHCLGDPHAQHQRLESALLPHDRRSLRALPGNVGPGGLDQVRRGGRRCPRLALRELHGPLRLRSQRRTRHQLSAR
jgi:hypothetical protein